MEDIKINKLTEHEHNSDRSQQAERHVTKRVEVKLMKNDTLKYKKSDDTLQTFEATDNGDDNNTNDSKCSDSSSNSSKSLTGTDAATVSASPKQEKNENKDELDEKGTESAEEDKTEFCVKPNKTNEFKLRIVPLEKLLAKPLKERGGKNHDKERTEKSRRNLPRRSTRKPITIIDLSDSEETEETEKSEETEKDEEENLKEPRDEAKYKSVKILSDQNKNSNKKEEQEQYIATTVVSERKNISAKERPIVKSPNTTTKRCVVKVKRIKLPLELNQKLNNIKHNTNNNNNNIKMNGGGSSEKPSTSSSSSSSLSAVMDKAGICKSPAVGDDDDEGDSNFALTRTDIRNDKNNSNAAAKRDESDSSSRSSDSEVIPTRKRRIFRKNASASDSDFEPEPKQKRKRRRIKRNSSEDEDDDDNDSDDDNGDGKKGSKKRKHIRKIMRTEDLNISTKTATKEEEERRKRIEERQKLYNKIYEKPESVEVTELVLDFDEETKNTLLEVDKNLLKKLKPHQVAGVKFMWDACFETIKDAESKPGSGCILAHCMGLGKTMQIVTLSHTLLTNSRKTNVDRVLIITPLSTLNNWAREFNHWISFTRKRNVEVYDMSKYKDKNTRIFKLNEWFEEGGVCILGYDMYRILTNEKAKGLRKKQRESLQQSLVDPGPDLVVCDEGHLLKNEKTSISKAVTRMRTRRRIVLTGTPLQNNLKEYYCMIQFIKPNLLGTYKEYLNRFVNPITNGQYTDSTDRDIRLMKHRSHILHKLLEGCIQRRDYSVLAPYLPPKYEYVVYTTLSELQRILYEHYMLYQRDVSNSDIGSKGARLFQDFQELRRIWTHPMNMRINSDSVIRKKVQNNDNDSMDDFICDNDDEEDDASTSECSVDSTKSFGSGDDGAGAGINAGSSRKAIKTRNNRKNAVGQNNENVKDDSDVEEVPVTGPDDDPSEWWKRFVADHDLNNLHHSPKLYILMCLLEQCEAIGDKLLVFSQSLQSLDTIEHFLALIDSKTRNYDYDGDVGNFKGYWTPGMDYFRLDGSCTVEQRESMCRKFNDTSNLRARLFLISTRAGGLGINLVSANRVVIFDVSWNPSHDTQSIFRVYRFGQDKPCYIYRMIAMGTMEQKLYERQVAKQATAKRVIDEQQISRHYNQSDLLELYTYELTPSTPREIPILPKDRLFAELLSEHENLLFKYHEHDSLLENEESENLSEAERKAAWSEYEAEKTRNVQTAQYMAYDRGAYGGQYGNASGSVTSNKIFGFRTDVILQLLNMQVAQDHPEFTQTQVLQLVPTYLQQLYREMNSGDPTMYKSLLNLHASLVHPSGMYMNPLLYVNQNPEAAGYQQRPAANGVINAAPIGAVPLTGIPAPLVMANNPQPPGFDPDQVYEID